VLVERDENRVACRDNGRGTLHEDGQQKVLGILLSLICVTSTQRSIGVVYYGPAFGTESARIRQISAMPPSTITVWPVM
jgi:hypothetical protein